jgi:hypothetical protein
MNHRFLTGMLAASAMLLAGVVVAATQPGKATLSVLEQKVLAASTCGSMGLDSAAARTAGKSSTMASVRCLPHGKAGEVPLARVAQCAKQGATWTCVPARDALMLKMPDESVLALVVDGVRPAEAIQTVNSIADLSVPPFQGGATEVLQDQCSLRQLPERAFKGATHFSLDCIGGTLAVTRDCWNGRCRFFITQATKRD